ncbi:putative G-patch domain protein [Aspergillus steynii IBT 23096]|uniref:Putative G-patch domain protein n=1 Tax=Aspergillus steynii IBT 23096 TaxID=1392250 RepID=A0A2I2FVR4_9EURO|nr:putative G-patch domain protein [Aspergillus steynii IBT 23096]PLB44715.1 putative G-patch domain protein [Aspergillus steynii IBT 23096]
MGPPRDPASGEKVDLEEEEDDYMSMVIEEPQQKETFAQKKRRQQREAEARARVPSKAERAAQEAERRDAALTTSTLDPSNKGFQMMAKLGFKPGQALGKDTTDKNKAGDDANDAHASQSRSEPLNLVLKEGRGGIGLDSEKKRKFREEAEEAVKKIKQDEGDYRDRVRLERETRRTEAQVHAAQKVAERLDTEAEVDGATSTTTNNESSRDPQDPITDEGPSENMGEKTGAGRPKTKVKPTSQINILYRGLVREREERERSLQARHLLQSSLPSSFFPNTRLPSYDDPTLEREDKQALAVNPESSSILEQELEEEDSALDEFNALDPGERLARLVRYLRQEHRYCFWCKCSYETDEMEGCPGITEEDHD